MLGSTCGTLDCTCTTFLGILVGLLYNRSSGANCSARFKQQVSLRVLLHGTHALRPTFCDTHFGIRVGRSRRVGAEKNSAYQDIEHTSVLREVQGFVEKDKNMARAHDVCYWYCPCYAHCYSSHKPCNPIYFWPPGHRASSSKPVASAKTRSEHSWEW